MRTDGRRTTSARARCARAPRARTGGASAAVRLRCACCACWGSLDALSSAASWPLPLGRFGRRADRDGEELGRPIVQGSRLALHLSPRGADGRRTARFFVDKQQVAVFAGIDDDGGSSDWVAGVTLSNNARVRLVPAEGVELQ